MQKILVVEDDFDIQELLQNFLQEAGYEVARRLYALVSEHGADRFDGNTVGEEYRRGCRVAALMPRDMLGDAATLGSVDWMAR